MEKELCSILPHRPRRLSSQYFYQVSVPGYRPVRASGTQSLQPSKQPLTGLT
ncbi:hypothetical protein J6590_100692 [Homalodisca vitripennis]|nr:hypothetical protein J6590_100692 [Homalodisca vitripennis]